MVAGAHSLAVVLASCIVVLIITDSVAALLILLVRFDAYIDLPKTGLVLRGDQLGGSVRGESTIGGH